VLFRSEGIEERTGLQQMVRQATRGADNLKMKIESRSAEINHVDTCALRNNLTLNRKKSTEIVFADTRKKSQVAASPPMAGITRVTSLKVLGVAITNGMSASNHVRAVVTDCSQSLYALRLAHSRLE